MKKITLIYSGGSDSFTLLHHALSQGLDVDCISFGYGQKHIKELEYAKENCKELNLKHTLIDIGDPLSIFGSTSLVDVDNKIPHGSYKEESMKSTIVPNRNMIFISYAIAYSIANNISEVWYGAHAGDQRRARAAREGASRVDDRALLGARLDAQRERCRPRLRSAAARHHGG